MGKNLVNLGYFGSPKILETIDDIEGGCADQGIFGVSGGGGALKSLEFLMSGHCDLQGFPIR